jgi:hypothetical protein
VGDNVGDDEGNKVGFVLGAPVGKQDGEALRSKEGAEVTPRAETLGCKDGASLRVLVDGGGGPSQSCRVGAADGLTEGDVVGATVGAADGLTEDDAVGATVGDIVGFAVGILLGTTLAS